MSTADILNLMIAFGSLLISLITLMVMIVLAIIKKDK
ncbi:MAG: putative holin-like toxin [Gemella sp.]|nr:putative holin-like toxin [Gemella sp.]